MSEKRQNLGRVIFNGILTENPTFRLVLGTCPTLAVTTSAINGLGMGAAATFVLLGSNVVISALRKFIPDRVRMPAFIVVVASFVTIVDLLMQAYVRSLYGALGLYIPLIVVNCIILGRAEAYASKNPPVASFFDGLGLGIGFTLALTLIGAFRELLGNGAVFGYRIFPESMNMLVFVLAPGAFISLGLLMAIVNFVKNRKA